MPFPNDNQQFLPHAAPASTFHVSAASSEASPNGVSLQQQQLQQQQQQADALYWNQSYFRSANSTGQIPYQWSSIHPFAAFAGASNSSSWQLPHNQPLTHTEIARVNPAQSLPQPAFTSGNCPQPAFTSNGVPYCPQLIAPLVQHRSPANAFHTSSANSSNSTGDTMPTQESQGPAATAFSAIRPEETHTILWAIAESHIARAQQLYKAAAAETAAAADSMEHYGDWKPAIVAALACLYSILHLCESPKNQPRYLKQSLILGPDVEARTRLRVAQVLSEWCEDSEGGEEEEHHLKRALMILPTTDHYLDLRYSIVAAQCRLFLRRGEQKWAEQKMKSAFSDAQQRAQGHWVHYFMLKLSKLYFANNDVRSSINTLQFSIRWARQHDDIVSEAVSSVQQLGILVYSRSWSTAASLITSLAELINDKKLSCLPQIRTRFWVLKASALAMSGKAVEAQEACSSARQALKEWQAILAKGLANKNITDGGASFTVPGTRAAGDGFKIRGWSYYEAHAWVMLVSALCVRGENVREESSGYLRLAQEGIVKGELDGAGQMLLPIRLQVLLHKIDICLATLQMEQAQKVLDQVMGIVAEAENQRRLQGSNSSSEFWRSNRDAIALRWAMFKHRTGRFDEAIDAYQCVASNGPADIQYAARVNLVMLYLSAGGDDRGADVQQLLGSMQDEISTAPNGSHELVRQALLDFLQGVESKEPVKAKTHLLACLRACSQIAETVLQGWTLCMLGTLVLPTGQYDQAMKMCAAGQAIAQKAQDPLQNAAAISILADIEKAVGDQERCEKLLQVSRRCLEQFDAKTRGFS